MHTESLTVNSANSIKAMGFGVPTRPPIMHCQSLIMDGVNDSVLPLRKGNKANSLILRLFNFVSNNTFRHITLLQVVCGIAALIYFTTPVTAQINLNTSIPAPQVKGIVQPVNGGFGIDTSSANGCPKATNGVWTVNSANCGGSETPLAITSFTGCSGTLELGATISSPTCSATYSGSPTSASITNTDGVSSPTNLSSPFTSGTIVGSFTHSTATTTTFTLTAVGSSTQTATQAYSWKPAIFGGVGTTGATATVTASGTTAVLSTGSSIARTQLGAETVGETFGPYAASGQTVYLLLTGASHTFTDNCSGFPFAFNAPLSVSFVNANGATVPMYLYASTNPLTGSCFSPKVAS